MVKKKFKKKERSLVYFSSPNANKLPVQPQRQGIFQILQKPGNLQIQSALHNRLVSNELHSG